MPYTKTEVYKKMVQATTPTFVLTLPRDINLEEAVHVKFTMKQGLFKLTKSDEQIELNNNIASVRLSQGETLVFAAKPAEIQLNWIYADGTRAATDIVTVDVKPNLHREVMPSE